MTYYARKDKNGKPESLEHHTLLVAKKSSEYAEAFGCGKIGELCGYLHDCGKHTYKFQEVLFGNRTKVDHSIVAAILIFNNFPEIPQSAREILAGVCAAHHSGLRCKSYDYRLPNDYNSRVALLVKDDAGYEEKENALSSEKEYADIVEYENTFIEGLKHSMAYKRLIKVLRRFVDNDECLSDSIAINASRMFFARMLLSCLVDADYSSAASWDEPAYFKNSELQPLSEPLIDEMLNHLESYRNEIIRGSDQTAQMNILRGIVYRDAYDAGKRPGCGFRTMTAPTGTAKTLAIMKYALEKAKVEHHKRIFVILPFLSIITQNADEYKKIFGDDIVLEDDSRTEYTDQTRAYSDRWSAPIIVTTTVKFFSTLFASRSTELRRLHQVADSVVVFDECQSLPSSVLDCTIYILQQLAKNYHTDILLSTATLPSYNYRNQISWQREEIIKNVKKLYEDYHIAKKTDIEFAPGDKKYSAKDLVNVFSGNNQAVFIFNTTKKAKEMYDELIRVHGQKNCRLLTSALCSDHKRDLITWTKQRLKSKNPEPCYLSSTQSIEAGVDVSFPCGAREYAPFPSVAQSAGRINRNGEGNGYLLVFRHKNHSKYDYPGADYMTASDQTLHMAEKKRKKGSFLSTDSLDDMDQYYKRLYRSEAAKKDRRELTEAILEENYHETEDYYSIIEDKGQLNIIVPYKDNEKSIKTYNTIAAELREADYGITKSQMKRASGITVSVYTNHFTQISACCQQLYFMTNAGLQATNWYLLENLQYYTEHGLDVTDVDDVNLSCNSLK
ncbi:CRISPR-associated helicase Cas3' [Bilifractor sp. LCP19S3_H10]|uniref:CRISPR-associated helicase Cas3' n=1 Tax=Bilifractor sp. LCP19S3_H10 TaxID=3438736 RepID=UPI003F8D9610